jgi:hypothetical protein
MTRHIQRKHNGLVQPVDLLKVNEYQYQNRRNVILNEECNRLQSGGFSLSIPSYSPQDYYHHRLLHPYSNYKMQRQKQEEQEQYRDKENTPFSADSTEKNFLQPLRQLREFKQLLYDVFLDPRWTLQYHYYQLFNTISNNNNKCLYLQESSGKRICSWKNDIFCNGCCCVYHMQRDGNCENHK